jgi:hypothetical protein
VEQSSCNVLESEEDQLQHVLDLLAFSIKNCHSF